MSMEKYILSRMIQIIITFFIVMSIIFLLFRVIPSDPTSFLLTPSMTAEAKETIREQFGLNEPIITQYYLYFKNFFHGNFGNSFYSGRPVISIIKERMLNSIFLLTTAVILSYIIGITIGKAIAWKRGSKTEKFFVGLGLWFYTMFTPWLGILFLWIFAFKLHLFPLGGMITPEIWLTNPPLIEKICDLIHHLILPLTTYTLLWFGGRMLLMRNSMLETLKEDYIITARAKGLKEKDIRDKHAARNAMLPIVTAFAISLSFSIAGAVLIETVFSWPGIGRTIVEATLRQDYPLVQGAFTVITIVVLIANFMADIAYAYLDPRISY
ncbi:MAG TPA: ABC transporter permease [Methanomicrobia archaeon]|nr:MAG: ABC transporter permease [Thermococci archaeon]HDN81681.1 ABC transporter permease [Methanomicrobia archaeon]